jgi:hypothetical protein
MIDSSTQINKSSPTLTICFGSCKFCQTKEEFLTNNTLSILPANTGYTVDSFEYIISLPRGEGIGPFKVVGNKLTGEAWEHYKKAIESGSRLFFLFSDVYVSGENGTYRILKGPSCRVNCE